MMIWFDFKITTGCQHYGKVNTLLLWIVAVWLVGWQPNLYPDCIGLGLQQLSGGLV